MKQIKIISIFAVVLTPVFSALQAVMKSTVHIHNGFIYEWAEEKLHYFLAGRLF
jgi:hypothetical protein